MPMSFIGGGGNKTTITINNNYLDKATADDVQGDPPPTPTIGKTWFNTDDNNLYIYQG